MNSLPEATTVLGQSLRPQHVPLTGPPPVLGAQYPEPRVALWLVGAEVDLNAAASGLLASTTAPPFWAFCWGSGQALARYIAAHPERFAGKRVVDYGAGSGIAAIAAAKYGAAEVTAVDIDENALTYCQRNAKLNNVQLNTATALPATYDILLSADVLYEDRALLTFLETQAQRCEAVFLADPQRASSPRLKLAPIACYEVRTLPDVDPPMRTAHIYELHR